VTPRGKLIAGLTAGALALGTGVPILGSLVLETDPPADVQLDCEFNGRHQVPVECVCIPGIVTPTDRPFTFCPHPENVGMLLSDVPGLYCECAEPELSIDDARMLVTR
jgi:hypothetical protein